MVGKTFGFVGVLYHFLTPALGCNSEILDSEAHSINSKLSMHKSVSLAEIKDSLYFVYDENAVDERYKKTDEFESLYKRIALEAEGPLSKEFALNCRRIYDDENSTIKVKMSVHLLLEKVRGKYLQLIKLIKKHENILLDEQYDAVKIPQADADRAVRNFFDENNIKAR